MIENNPTVPLSATSLPKTGPKPLFSELEIGKCIQASWIADDGTLYASSHNTICKSTTEGVTWAELKTFNSISLDSVFVNSQGYVFVSPGLGAKESDSGLWRSTTAGRTWTKVLSLPLFCSIWGMDEDCNRTLFACVYTRDKIKNARIYRSADSGASWVPIYYDSNARHMHHVVVDKINNNIYATVGDKFVPQSNIAYVLCSLDGGDNWNRILPRIPQIFAIAAVPGARLFGTDDITNGEMFRSTDDAAFNKVLDTGAQSYCFWIRRDGVSGRIYASFVGGEAAKRTAGIYVSDNEGLNWNLYRSFKTALAYEGSSRATNFVRGMMYYSLRLDGRRKNGVKIF